MTTTRTVEKRGFRKIAQERKPDAQERNFVKNLTNFEASTVKVKIDKPGKGAHAKALRHQENWDKGVGSRVFSLIDFT